MLLHFYKPSCILQGICKERELLHKTQCHVLTYTLITRCWIETNPKHIPHNLGQQLVMEQYLPLLTVRDMKFIAKYLLTEEFKEIILASYIGSVLG